MFNAIMFFILLLLTLIISFLGCLGFLWLKWKLLLHHLRMFSRWNLCLNFNVRNQFLQLLYLHRYLQLKKLHFLKVCHYAFYRGWKCISCFTTSGWVSFFLWGVHVWLSQWYFNIVTYLHKVNDSFLGGVIGLKCQGSFILSSSYWWDVQGFFSSCLSLGSPFLLLWSILGWW